MQGTQNLAENVSRILHPTSTVINARKQATVGKQATTSGTHWMVSPTSAVKNKEGVELLLSGYLEKKARLDG